MKIVMSLMVAVLFAVPSLAKNVECPCFDTESVRQLVESNGTQPSKCITDNDSSAYIWYISSKGWIGASASIGAEVEYTCEFIPFTDIDSSDERLVTKLEMRQCIENLRHGASSCDYD
jgi:hypothetical protein